MDELQGTGAAAVGLSTLAGILAWAFAVFVLRARPNGIVNRRLATFLAFEGLLMLSFLIIAVLHLEETTTYVLAMPVLLALEGTAQILLVGTLASPLAWLGRSRAGIVVVAAIATATVAFAPLRVAGVLGPVSFLTNPDALGWVFLAVAAVYALVTSIDAFRRTPRGTAAHRRAATFTAAFGARDGLFALGIVTWGVSDSLGLIWLRDMSELVSTIGTLLIVVLLSYGVLSAQLFDIDLKLKWGIRRGTLASILVGGFFAAYKVAEFYMGREVGWMFGGILSGVFFFLAPRLNKFADTVANKAMPQVQPTPEYLTYKKLEVYRSAVESALEGGGLDARDRALLDRMRGKLGLKQADADALEAELLAAWTPPTEPPQGATA